MKKILLFAALLFSFEIWGQGEISICAGGGMNTLFMEPSLDEALPNGSKDADASLSWGCAFGARYVFFFRDKNLGIGSGADFLMYNSSVSLNGRMVTPSYDDENGQSFDLIQDYRSWKESQRLFTLEVPLGAYYQFFISDKMNVLCGLGGKLIIPVNSRYKVQEGEYETTGYYPQTNVVLNNLPHHGFLNSSPVAQGGLDTKLSFAVYGEAGMNFTIADNLQFYVGLYCNYGLNEFLKNKKKVEPSIMDNFFVDNESILDTRVVDEAKIFAAGLKLGITIPSNLRNGTRSNARDEHSRAVSQSKKTE